MRHEYEPHFDTYLGHIHEAMLHHDDPHPKRVLRKEAYHELITDGKYETPNHTWTRKTVWWKLKKNEWAKPGKYPRSIVDIGVGGSLAGFRLMQFFKEAQNMYPLEYKGGFIAFCKTPAPRELHGIFNMLFECPYRFVFIYFSDDACLAYRHHGDIWRFNLDISSCDASHTTSMFTAFYQLFPKLLRHEVKILINQCKLPLKITDLNNPKQRCHLQPLTPKLYSGSTITTGLNGVANMCIAMSIADATINHPIDIQHAAEEAGYIVTGAEEPLHHFEHVQFLKHSPVRSTTGDWEPMLNLGVLLRALGTCNGDLPGTGPLRPRAEAFQRGLLKGAYPYTRSTVLHSIWQATGFGDIETKAYETFSRKVVDTEDYPPYTADDDSFCRRYSLTHHELVEMCELLKHGGYGYTTRCSAYDKILFTDYGLSTTDPVTHHFRFT